MAAEKETMTAEIDNRVAYFASKHDGSLAQITLATIDKSSEARHSIATIHGRHVICRHSVDAAGAQTGYSYLCEDERFRSRENCEWNDTARGSSSDEFAEYVALPVGTIITSPGKFEGEPRYVPEFWHDAVHSNIVATEDGPDVYRLDVEQRDIDRYPELFNVKHVDLWESDNGFVFADAKSPH